MARKDLLKGLLGEGETKGAEKTKEASAQQPKDQAAPRPLPRYAKGAIGAVSKSIAELKSRSISEIDPFDIEAGGVQDRLESDDTDHAQLMQSIREYGQQVPVLVRPHPGKEGAYQIVYGRRRVLALRDLGLPVKAMIRDLDDRELVVAQGQENTVRKDLSFIEKANFARQMRDADYDRKIICDALHIDKTVVSRMLAIVDRLPVEVIESIGPAPSVGRDRWLALADGYERSDYDADTAISMIAVATAADTSDGRFEALLKAVSEGQRANRATKPTPQKPQLSIRSESGTEIARANKSRGKTTLILNTKKTEGFDDWLIENLEGIHRSWKEQGGE